MKNETSKQATAKVGQNTDEKKQTRREFNGVWLTEQEWMKHDGLVSYIILQEAYM